MTDDQVVRIADAVHDKLMNGPIKELQESVGELQESVGELQESVGELQGSVGELQGSVGELQESVGELQESVGINSEGIASISIKVDDMYRWQTDMNHNIGAIRDHLGI